MKQTLLAPFLQSETTTEPRPSVTYVKLSPEMKRSAVHLVRSHHGGNFADAARRLGKTPAFAGVSESSLRRWNEELVRRGELEPLPSHRRTAAAVRMLQPARSVRTPPSTACTMATDCSFQRVFAPKITKKRGRKRVLSEATMKLLERRARQVQETEAGATLELYRVNFLSVIQSAEPEALSDMFGVSIQWVGQFLRNRMGFSRRKGTTSAQKLPDDWEAKVEDMVQRLALLVSRHKLPPAMVVNADQTAVQLMNGHNYTYAPKGSKVVKIQGKDDKRNFTVNVPMNANGLLLPFQVIFQGKTERCLPKSRDAEVFMKDDIHWHFTHTENHWASESTMKDFVNKILAPYFEKTRVDLSLPSDTPGVLLVDCWSVHISEAFRAWMKQEHKHIIMVYVPASCTGVAQPVDLAVNQPLKAKLRALCANWMVETMLAHEEDGSLVKTRLDTRLSNLKTRFPLWLHAAWSDLRRDSVEQLRKGWERPGLLRAWEPTTQVKAFLREAELFPNQVPHAAESVAEPASTTRLNVVDGAMHDAAKMVPPGLLCGDDQPADEQQQHGQQHTVAQEPADMEIVPIEDEPESRQAQHEAAQQEQQLTVAQEPADMEIVPIEDEPESRQAQAEAQAAAQHEAAVAQHPQPKRHRVDCAPGKGAHNRTKAARKHKRSNDVSIGVSRSRTLIQRPSRFLD